MSVSIMQPYFFPYIGYFQLMATCDVFVVRDDVQYIQHGWVNRNRILVNGDAQWITLPVAKADHRLPINRREYLLEDPLSQRVRRRIEGAYRGAPHFEETMEIFDEAFGRSKGNVAVFNTHLLSRVAERLGITTPMLFASDVDRCESLSGQGLVVDICASLGASGYINPIGGIDLYTPDRFRRQGLTLQFLQPCAPHYPQFGSPHVASLSIIDVMMFNDMSTVKRMLSAYRLIAGRTDTTGSAAAAAGCPGL